MNFKIVFHRNKTYKYNKRLFIQFPFFFCGGGTNTNQN